jgi:hypothetical protein
MENDKWKMENGKYPFPLRVPRSSTLLRAAARSIFTMTSPLGSIGAQQQGAEYCSLAPLVHGNSLHSVAHFRAPA